MSSPVSSAWIRAAGFSARKTLDEFVFDHQPGIRRDDVAPLAAGHYLTEARNVVLLGPPGTGKGQARWTMRWKPALNAFATTFADRCPAAETY